MQLRSFNLVAVGRYELRKREALRGEQTELSVSKEPESCTNGGEGGVGVHVSTRRLLSSPQTRWHLTSSYTARSRGHVALPA